MITLLTILGCVGNFCTAVDTRYMQATVTVCESVAQMTIAQFVSDNPQMGDYEFRWECVPQALKIRGG